MLNYISKVLYVMDEKKTSLFLLIFTFLLTSVLEAVGIGLVGPFILLVTEPERIFSNFWLNWAYKQIGINSISQFISLLGLIIIVIFCVKAYLYYLSQASIYKFSFTQKGKLCARLLHAYLTAPYIFHLNRNSAVIIKNIATETEKFCQDCIIPLLRLTASLTVVFILVLLLAKANLVLVVGLFGILLLAFFLYYRAKEKIVRWGREGSEANAAMIQIINHGLGGLKETHIIGCQQYFEAQISKEAQRYATAASLFHTFQSLPRITVEAILITFLISFVAVSINFFEENTQNITAVLGVFAVASIRLIPSFSDVLRSVGQLQNNSYILDKLYLDLKEIDEEIKIGNRLDVAPDSIKSGLFSKELKLQPITFVDQVVLDKVTYRYPNVTENAINDISLTINKGQSIAFIGKSGAGKTTLVDVILGLLIPGSGDIQVDGVSIYNEVRSWQNLLGYIPQSIFLMDDTVEKNIAFGVPDNLIDSSKLNKAIKAAQLADVVDQLPDGIKTRVGERGIRLSGGQRQRIGIARALYHEREILVLDEATAALDNETESLVTEAIKSLAGTKTLIIIAHRLSTVEHCDQVYVLEKGRVVKSGSFQEVVLEKSLEI
ncbi:MAG: ABC transporter ATP-binding protein/permease [Symplocastrum torsivum CPER-KK1]|jgi:ABC-type multidrug transport system fused ATPase/permease subunit|uniref:ABC transporter ATP-binding protein/permease n=1 Tax=Symplocastrum torsivum CPER-KK1 TaxID=450513 RepID=A0A951PRG8_9CYAN|nr:ABC transporter ATP-binding protein/permease [Symplocastrum torsivum CPER-KK1]